MTILIKNFAFSKLKMKFNSFNEVIFLNAYTIFLSNINIFPYQFDEF